jgi:DNA primase
MDAVTVINDHIDMEVLLEHYDFDKVKQSGRLIRACCKLHGGSNPTAFVVNTDNNLYYCHTGGCGGGNAYNLVMKLENCSFNRSVQILAGIFHVDIDNLEIIEHQPSYIKEMKAWIKTMKNLTKKKEVKEFTIHTPMRNVTKYKDFHTDTIAHFGLKYVESIDLFNKEGKTYTLKNRLLFPVIQENVMVGISLRRIKSTDVPKWSHQPVRFDTNAFLYNFDEVKDQSIITICEGITDVWAYYEIGIPACCTFGAHLTDKQYALLMKTGADLVWSYDGDDAGRKATDFALKRFKYKANQYVVQLEEGDDPASISREELANRYGEKERRN